MKRLLTKKEVDYLVKDIPFSSKQCCIYQLESIEIDPKLIPKLKKIINQKWKESRAEIGTPVGILASLCLTEPLTQGVLKTFHYAGVGGALVHQTTLSLPQIQKIIHVTKNNNPITLIHLKDCLFNKLKISSEKEIVTLTFAFAKRIRQCYVANLIEKIGKIKHGIYLPNWFSSWTRIYNPDLSFTKNGPNCIWTIKIKINKEKIFSYQVQLFQIRKAIDKLKISGVFCFESPLCYLEIIILIDTNKIPEDPIIRNKVNNLFKIDSTKKDNDMSNKKIIIKYNEMYITERIIDFITTIHPKKLDCLVSGIPGIKETQIVQDPITKKWIVQAAGSNLSSLFSHPFIDKSNTCSNNIEEIKYLLGMEAAAAYIRNMIKAIPGVGSINPAYYNLLVEDMTSSSDLRPINRHGMDVERSSPFGLLAFEEVESNLIKNTSMSFVDPMRSVSANVLFGQPPKIGTNGPFEIKLLTPSLKSYNKKIKNHIESILELEQQKLHEIAKETSKIKIFNLDKI